MWLRSSSRTILLLSPIGPIALSTILKLGDRLVLIDDTSIGRQWPAFAQAARLLLDSFSVRQICEVGLAGFGIHGILPTIWDLSGSSAPSRL